ncbi:MAG TPA: serine/threonine protein kinase, partial [Deltaproteobacteria bacterium]|nr:serine/threonine protein kinase [Deltaproteobacteria bacterium]
MATLYCARCLGSFEGQPDTCPNVGCGAHRPHSGWGVLLDPGDLLDRHYVIERCLAVGGAGLTYLARETDAAGAPTGPKLAIKVLYSARAAGPFLRRLSNEAQILQELAHDNIVQLRGFVHRAGQEPYLVTLFEEGGSLSQHVARVGPLAPSVAVGVLRQILRALDVAHQAGVVHRDLKPDNVLLSTRVEADELPHCRVADFGIAKVSGGMGAQLTRLGAFVGTPEYAAPEQFAGVPPTPPTDVFAAGGLLVYLLTGHPPVSFTHRSDIEQSHDELLDQIPPILEPTQLRATAEEVAKLQEVVEHMMAPQAEERWTIRQTLAALTPLLERFPSQPPRPLDTNEADAGITFGLEPTDEERMVSAERARPSPPDAPPHPPPSVIGVAPDAPPMPPQTAPIPREWVEAARAEAGLPPSVVADHEPTTTHTGIQSPGAPSLLTATQSFENSAVSSPPQQLSDDPGPPPSQPAPSQPPPLPAASSQPAPIGAAAASAAGASAAVAGADVAGASAAVAGASAAVAGADVAGASAAVAGADVAGASVSSAPGAASSLSD